MKSLKFLQRNNPLAWLLLTVLLFGTLSGCGRSQRGCLGGVCNSADPRAPVAQTPIAPAATSEAGGEELISPTFQINDSAMGSAAMARSSSLGFVLDGGPSGNQ